MKYRQVCLYQLFEEWLVMSKIKHVEIKKEKFMNQTTYELDMIDYYTDPTDYFKKCLYLRKIGNQDICMYKNKRIHLSPRLFDALFTMAEDTSKTHKLDTIYRENGAAEDNERQIAARINKAFKNAGFTSIVKKEIRAGYCVNLEIVPNDFIVTTLK